MSWQDFVTISPLVAGILTAVAILVVDLIRPGKSAVAVGVALTGLAITAVLTIAVGAGTTPSMAFGGAYKVDALTTFLDVLFIAIIAMSIVFGPDYLVPRGLPVAEFAAILVFAMTGAMLISALGRPAAAVPGPRADGPAGLHARGLPQDRRLLDRGRDQVLPARLVQLGHLPVRAVVRVGPHRHDPDRRDRRRAGQDRGGRGSAVARAGDGPGLPDDRRRVQDRRGAVPLLDAGRVPGLADADHGLPVGRPQGRRLRAHPAPVRRGARAAGRLVDAGRHRAGHLDHDPRQPRRADPGQRQADARLQLDRPHRLHARRPGGVGR